MIGNNDNNGENVSYHCSLERAVIFTSHRATKAFSVERLNYEMVDGKLGVTARLLCASPHPHIPHLSSRTVRPMPKSSQPSFLKVIK